MTSAAPHAEATAEAALRAHRAGLCVVPVAEDGSKRPDLDAWTEYQHRRSTADEVREWFANGRTGVGVICGAVSGGLELFDFDERDVFDDFVALARASGCGDLLDRILAGYTEQTPSGGIHSFYFCDSPRTTKLARRPKRPEEQRDPHDRIKTRIETKGEGGFSVTATSSGRVHETGRPYVLLCGDFGSIVRISDEERETLHALARTFDQMPRPEPRREEPRASRSNGELRPGDDFNARATWAELLKPHGWAFAFERGGEAYWRRPGKSEGISATTNYRGSGLFYCFSSSTPFEIERGYDLFGALAVLEHGGDLRAAARALAAHGFGASPRQATREPEPDEPPPPTDADAPIRGPASEADILGAGGPEPEEDAAPRLIQLRTLTAAEFETDVAPAALVERMLYAASTHTITGASKAGKTWTALQLAMAVCAGWLFLGLKTVAARVLYLSFELSAGMLRGRMQEINAGTGIPLPAIGETLHVVAPTAEYLPHLDLGTEEGSRELERVIGETGAELVILDTLYRFLPGADPNDNGEMGRIFGRINDLAQRTGAGLVLLDHVGKGEQLGPVSHSALGASVKGGAARVVIALRRTSREDGGRWQLDVESHFGSWDEPLHYERPRLPDGTRGGGCSLCTATEAHGLKFETVRALFADYGALDEQRRPFFGSKRKLREALFEAKLAAGNAQGDEAVGAILRDYCAPEHAAGRHPERPILTRDAPNRALVFTWRMPVLESEQENPRKW